MFTGIIEQTGTLIGLESRGGVRRITVEAPELAARLREGDSLGVSGVCLTALDVNPTLFHADLAQETLDKTSLGALAPGSKVNLERALRFSDRLGGHIVAGHVDDVGKLVNRQAAGNATVYRFSVPFDLREFIVQKGSIAVDGISLTVMDLTPDGFTTAVIPHTEEVTTLKEKPIGGGVNIEVDLMAKYVRSYVMRYMGVEDSVDAGKGVPRRGLTDLLRDLTDGK